MGSAALPFGLDASEGTVAEADADALRGIWRTPENPNLKWDVGKPEVGGVSATHFQARKACIIHTHTRQVACPPHTHARACV
jgi:hypothetical protein